VEGRLNFIAYVRRELLGERVERPATATPAFNTTQSTHTASVHTSVSASAIRLRESYGSRIASQQDLNAVIAEMGQWVASISRSSQKGAAAARCFRRITAYHYFFTDPTSQVSTRLLLAFVWRAVHDNAKRTGSLDDAQALLIDGLYEIQRGYNLSEEGEDDELDDHPICVAGTFNKLMEKLNGIHSDVEVYYITTQGAALKLPPGCERESLGLCSKSWLSRKSGAVNTSSWGRRDRSFVE
ncbi:MAG: hypothetical protein ACOYKA_00320, partial [Legionellaceae bacterium]